MENAGDDEGRPIPPRRRLNVLRHVKHARNMKPSSGPSATNVVKGCRNLYGEPLTEPAYNADIRIMPASVL